MRAAEDSVTEVVAKLKRTENPGLRWALVRSAGAAHWCRNGHVVRSGRVKRYLASTNEPRLQIGSGPERLRGWLNSDLIAGDVHLDLERRLPFADRSFAFVFGEHVIEHLAPPRANNLLVELHRILRPGGVLRLTTPDLRKIIALYEDRNPVVARAEYAEFLGGLSGKPYDQPARILNDYFRLWGHRHIYDEEDLTACLTAAGFADVVRNEPGDSAHPALRDVERHGSADWVNRAEAMCLEASRSGS